MKLFLRRLVVFAFALVFLSFSHPLRAEIAEAANAADVAETTQAADTAKVSEIAESDWLVLIYMSGGVAESSMGNASADLLELLDARVDSSKVRIVVQTGGAKKWEYLRIPTGSLGRYTIEGGRLVKLETQAASSMADENNLASFLEFAYSRYRGRHTMLLLWDHNTGGMSEGIVTDEIFQDSMSMQELARGLEKASSATGSDPFDIIFLDADNMSVIDTIATLQPYGGYLLANEKISPWLAWDYTSIFYRLNQQSLMNGEDLAKMMIASYILSCNEHEYTDISVSLIDLTRARSLILDYHRLGCALLSNLQRGTISKAEMDRIALDSSLFGYGILHHSTGKRATGDLVDLHSFYSSFRDHFPEETAKFEEDLKRSIAVFAQLPYTFGTGIGMYYPLSTVYLDRDAVASGFQSVTRHGYASYADLSGIAAERILSSKEFFDYLAVSSENYHRLQSSILADQRQSKPEGDQILVASAQKGVDLNATGHERTEGGSGFLVAPQTDALISGADKEHAGALTPFAPSDQTNGGSAQPDSLLAFADSRGNSRQIDVSGGRELKDGGELTANANASGEQIGKKAASPDDISGVKPATADDGPARQDLSPAQETAVNRDSSTEADNPDAVAKALSGNPPLLSDGSNSELLADSGATVASSGQRSIVSSTLTNPDGSPYVNESIYISPLFNYYTIFDEDEIKVLEETAQVTVSDDTGDDGEYEVLVAYDACTVPLDSKLAENRKAEPKVRKISKKKRLQNEKLRAELSRKLEEGTIDFETYAKGLCKTVDENSSFEDIVFCGYEGLHRADLSKFKDYSPEVTFSPDGVSSIAIDKKILKHISDVTLDLAVLRVPKETDASWKPHLLELGFDGRLSSDWKNGVFKDRFDGRWMSLDGYPLPAVAISETADFVGYASSVTVNKKEAMLYFVHDLASNTYKLVCYFLMDSGVAPHLLSYRLKPGDIVTMNYRVTDLRILEDGSVARSENARNVKESLVYTNDTVITRLLMDGDIMVYRYMLYDGRGGRYPSADYALRWNRSSPRENLGTVAQVVGQMKDRFEESSGDGKKQADAPEGKDAEAAGGKEIQDDKTPGAAPARGVAEASAAGALLNSDGQKSESGALRPVRRGFRFPNTDSPNTNGDDK